MYNVQQLRHRLHTANLYVANTKAGGFAIEATCNDPTQVVVGVRVMMGTQDATRIPSSIEVFGRSQTVNLTR